MSEITNLNSAGSYLTENTLEVFTPSAEIESADMQHLGKSSIHVWTRREGDIRPYKGVFLRDEELLSNFGIIRLHVFMTRLNNHEGRGHKTMQREGETSVKAKKEDMQVTFVGCMSTTGLTSKVSDLDSSTSSRQRKTERECCCRWSGTWLFLQAPS